MRTFPGNKYRMKYIADRTGQTWVFGIVDTVCIISMFLDQSQDILEAKHKGRD